MLEEVATLTGLAVGPTYTTAAYAHTDFQRPPLLLTGNTSDHGAHTVHMERLPFEELVVEVEVDTMVAVEAEAAAKLYAEDGTFVAVANTASSLEPGLVMVEFRFRAGQIFQAGKPGPYTVQLFSIWGTSADGTAVSLQAPGVVAVTQPYRLEDFAPSPGFTVGGTLTGMIGSRQVELELATEGPPGTPPITTLRPRNGPFTFFLFPQLVSGNSYQVRVNPAHRPGPGVHRHQRQRHHRRRQRHQHRGPLRVAALATQPARAPCRHRASQHHRPHHDRWLALRAGVPPRRHHPTIGRLPQPSRGHLSATTIVPHPHPRCERDVDEHGCHADELVLARLSQLASPSVEATSVSSTTRGFRKGMVAASCAWSWSSSPSPNEGSAPARRPQRPVSGSRGPWPCALVEPFGDPLPE